MLGARSIHSTNLSVRRMHGLFGLAFSICLPAALVPTFALSPRLGHSGAADRMFALHLSAVVRRFGLFLPVDNHPAWAGCSFSRATLTAFASNAHTGQTSRLSSVFVSLQRYPIEPASFVQ